MEKQYAPTTKEKKIMKKQPKQNEIQPHNHQPKQEEKIDENIEKKEEKIIDEKIEKEQEKKEAKEEQKTEEQEVQAKTKHSEEIKKPAKKIKKEEVFVNAKSVPVSTKYAINICKFVKNKRIGDAIRDLEQVTLLKKSVPMKGEYSHRKGRGMSGGAYPQRAAKQFIVLLKSLAGNADNHEINEPIIVEASANWAPAPKGRFGRIRRKRTHVTLRAVEMKIKNSEQIQVKSSKNRELEKKK
ncbi:MAG: uL22 family ribosomal protein [Nanoarchaeota archaeon]